MSTRRARIARARLAARLARWALRRYLAHRRAARHPDRPERTRSAMTTYDLAARRAARAKERAAAAAGAPGREARGETFTINLGPDPRVVPTRGKPAPDLLVVLPAEFPVNVFAPLRRLGDDIALLLRQGMDLFMADYTDATQDEKKTAVQTGSLIVDLLVANPRLPEETIGVMVDMVTELVGPEGWANLVAARLSREDIADLISDAGAFYGFGRGESSGSSASPEPRSDGGTLPATSPTTTPDSTPETPSETQPTLDSSESVA